MSVQNEDRSDAFIPNTRGVLLGERKDKGVGVPLREPPHVGVDASLRLTKEDDIGRQGKVLVVIGRVSTQQFGYLHRLRGGGPPCAHNGDVVEEARRKVLLHAVDHYCNRKWKSGHRSSDEALSTATEISFELKIIKKLKNQNLPGEDIMFDGGSLLRGCTSEKMMARMVMVVVGIVMSMPVLFTVQQGRHRGHGGNGAATETTRRSGA